MNWLAGVDEAGLGPILGPLVVAGVSVSGPAGGDPWQLLSAQVSRHKFAKGRVRVADSKKVNTGQHGLRHLERTALVFWAARHGAVPATLRDWLLLLGVDLEPYARCPWYERFDLPLPLEADRGECELLGEVLARTMRRKEVRVHDIAVVPVDVEEWNGFIADTDNKSRAHFRAFSRVLARLLAELPAGGHLVADRCGGRMHYRQDLQELCAGEVVAIVDERPECSVYELHAGGGGGGAATRRVTFSERGEDRSFPTALASCFAKYLRELMVHVLNQWFIARVPGLHPTAGYYTDGHRFLQDLEPHLPALQVPRDRLVRVR